MTRVTLAAIVAMTVSAVAVPGIAQSQQQKCPEGEHWHATQQKCVKHGD